MRNPLKKASIIILFFIVGVVSLKAEEWPRLPDGRVLIDVKGIKFAARDTGSALKDFEFMNYNGYSLPLGVAIQDPERAKRFFSETKTIAYGVSSLPDRTDKLLGVFDRAEYLGLGFAATVEDEPVVGCTFFPKEIKEVRLKALTDPAKFEADGWARYVVTKSPRNTVYVRSSHVRGFDEDFDGLNCNWADYCTAAICPGTPRSFSFSFNRKRQAVETWPSVYAKAKAVMHEIWPDLK